MNGGRNNPSRVGPAERDGPFFFFSWRLPVRDERRKRRIAMFCRRRQLRMFTINQLPSPTARSTWAVSSPRRKPYRRPNPRRIRRRHVSEGPEGNSQCCPRMPQSRPRLRVFPRPRYRRQLPDDLGPPGSRDNLCIPKPHGTDGTGSSNECRDRSVAVST